MIKNFLSQLFFLLTAPVIAYADKQAIDVVACVNIANGYPTEIDGEPWELAQAILEIPYDHERVRLAPDYHLGSDGWYPKREPKMIDWLSLPRALFPLWLSKRLRRVGSNEEVTGLPIIGLSSLNRHRRRNRSCPDFQRTRCQMVPDCYRQ